jgi:hypothetical protein
MRSTTSTASSTPTAWTQAEARSRSANAGRAARHGPTEVVVGLSTSGPGIVSVAAARPPSVVPPSRLQREATLRRGQGVPRAPPVHPRTSRPVRPRRWRRQSSRRERGLASTRERQRQVRVPKAQPRRPRTPATPRQDRRGTMRSRQPRCRRPHSSEGTPPREPAKQTQPTQAGGRKIESPSP